MLILLMLIVLIYRHIRFITLADILDLTESQAKVLRVIAFYEEKSGTKGVTQYVCYRKVPNRLHVSGSTFNDNIQDLEKKVMVLRLKGRTKRNRETKPYTITDVGQIAWLRYFSLSENIEIIQKIFPNIQIKEIDKIIDGVIDQSQYPVMKDRKNSYSKSVLEIALNSIHMETSNSSAEDYAQIMINETIELSGYYDLLKTSFTRNYNIIHPVVLEEFKHHEFRTDSQLRTNFDELEISVKDRITFLFYYNLIQSITESGYALKVISNILPKMETKMEEFVMKSKKNGKTVIHNAKIEERLRLSSSITNKKKEIMKVITSNDTVSKIIQDNLKELSEYKDTDFQNISKLFIKT